MFKNYLFRLGALLSLLVLARLADRAQQASLAAAGPTPPTRAAQPLPGRPIYLMVSQKGR